MDESGSPHRSAELTGAAACRSPDPSRRRRTSPLRAIGIPLLLALTASAANDWRWSHPEPHGNNIADLVYREGVYVQVTDHGGIYVSTNRVIWERRESGTLLDLRAAAYLGGRLLVTGESGTALWSDDAVRFNSATLTPPTTDWLEAVAAGNGVAVAVGDNGAIYRSTNGVAWSRLAEVASGTWLSGVAFGGGAFVAVGETGVILRSPDGQTWSRRNSGTLLDLARVVYGDGRFLAAGSSGAVLVSTDGLSWSADVSTGVTNSLYAAAMPRGERLVVGSGTLLLRQPPFGWLDQTSENFSPLPAPVWTYSAVAWDGARYVVGGRTGVTIESFQTNIPPFLDATLWVRLDDSPRNWLWDAARLAGTYLAVGDRGTILSSASGVSWALEASPAEVTTVLYGVGGSSNLALAVGSGGTVLRSAAWYTNVVVTNVVEAGGRQHALISTNSLSLLGLVWDPAALELTTNTLQGVAWDGTGFLVVGAQGTVLRSPDGTNWNRGTIPSSSFFSAVAPGRTGWVAAGSRGALFASPDGITWNPLVSSTTNWIYRLRALGERWVAVGQGGLILVSSNATDWVSKASGTDAWLTDVQAFGGAYWVTGTQGTLLRSRDLEQWDPVDLPTGKSLYALATAGAQSIVAGAEGIILRRVVDGVAPVALARFEHRRDAEPPVNLFLFEGAPEQRFRLERAVELGVWETAAELVLDAGGGMAYGLEAAGEIQFFRTVSGP